VCQTNEESTFSSPKKKKLEGAVGDEFEIREHISAYFAEKDSQANPRGMYECALIFPLHGVCCLHIFFHPLSSMLANRWCV
jgi:hypothetical protein